MRAQQDLIFTSPVSRACPTCSTYRSSLRCAHELYALDYLAAGAVRAQQDLVFASPVSRACPTCSTYRSSLRCAHELYDLDHLAAGAVRAQQDVGFASPVSRACPTCSTYRSSLRCAHELYDLRPRSLSGWCRLCSTCSTTLVFAAPVTRVRLYALNHDAHHRTGK